MIDLEQLEKEERWVEVINYLEKSFAQNKNIGVLIDTIFILWYILIEGKGNETNLKKNSIREMLAIYYNLALKDFDSNPDFLVLIGWCVDLLFWEFANATDDTGKEMMLKALEKNDKNVFYQWVNRDKLHLDSNSIKAMARNILENFDSIFTDHCYTLRCYFKSILVYSMERGV